VSLKLPAEAVRELEHCNKCGFCLPACPTYQETGLEMHSPRGRLSLAEAAWRGELSPGTGLADALAQCIGCRACESACPSGVHYGVVLEHARRDLRRQSRRYVVHTRAAGPLLGLVTRRRWFRSAVRVGRLARALPMPRSARALTDMLPEVEVRPARFDPPAARGPGVVPVYFVDTCVMDAVYPQANRDARLLLTAAGARILPGDGEEGCCGALHLHTGAYDEAIDLARAAVARYERSLPPETLIVSHSGGCGAMMREYGRLLGDDPTWAAKAAHWSQQVVDFAELLLRLPVPLRFQGTGAVVALQNSCHLVNGMQAGSAPVQLIRGVEGDQFISLPSQDRCCGSGGVYNLDQPAMAERVLARHLEEVGQHRVGIWIMNNPGCALQCERGAKKAGVNARVVHLASYLRERLAPVSG
jgi:glycolate oxidase iron-sulfur subunit